MARLFISYSRKDIDFARRLTDGFQDQELDFWIDWEGIPPTVDWWQEIEKGIEEADIFLFLLSPDSAISKVCKQEIEHATKNGKRLIPIVVRDFHGDEAPSELSQLNWIFFREDDDFEASFGELITAIKTDYEWVQIHKQLQVKALEWERSDHESSFLLRGRELQDAETQLATNSSKEPNPTNLQREYVLKSRQATDRQRRTTFGVAVAGVIALAALAVFGLIQAGLATEQANQRATAQANAEFEADQRATAQAVAEESQKLAEERARIARAKELAAQSVSLQESNFQSSLLLGVESFYLLDDAQTRGAILDSIRTNPQLQQIISGHSSTVNCVTYSPNGQLLASGSGDNTIILWDATTGKPVGQPLKGHSDTITSIAFSPDGKTLVSGAGDKKIIFWDVETGKPIGQPLTGHSGGITEVDYSANGKFIASGDWDGSIILWDAKTRQPIGEPLISDESGWVWSLTISPDSNTLVAAGFATENLSSIPVIPPYGTFWNVSTRQFGRQPLVQLQKSNDAAFGENIFGFAWDIVISPDGRILAAGTTEGPVILWDMRTKRIIGEPLIGHTAAATLAFNVESDILASASDDGTIILWDVETGQPIGKPMKGHSGEVNSVAFSPDGKNLVSGGDDGSIILWNTSIRLNTNLTASNPIGESLTSIYSSNFSMAFSPDGKTLASGNIFSISYWNMTTSPPYRLPPASNFNLGNLGEVHSVTFSPDGKFIASADSDDVTIWDATTREPVMEPFEDHSSTVNSVAFSPDSKILASADDDGKLILLDVRTHQTIGEPILGDLGSINSLAFSPDGNILAAGCDESSIILWDVSNPISLKVITKYAKENSVAAHTGPVNSVVFSPDSKILASGSEDNMIILWNVATGQPIGQPITGHSGSVTSVAFSPNGKMLASVGFDKTVILWDVETKRPIGQPLRGSQEIIYGVAFSPDGKTLASGGGSKSVMIWDLDPQSWIEKACQRAGRNFPQDEWQYYFPDEEYRKTCDQWPIDFGKYRQILEETIVNFNEPQQVQEAFDKVKDTMEMDTTSIIENPASAASKVITEWITAELLNRANDDWQTTLNLLDQLNTTYKNLPVNFPFIEQRIAGEVEGEILDKAKAANWKESLDMLEQINASFENFPIDFSFLKQSIENMVRNEIQKEVDADNWQNVLKLLDVVAEKSIPIDDASLLNKVCWNGSLNGYASHVLEYCEHAVKLKPEDANIRDSRGLARALTGDFQGAINDFQYYVDISNGSNAKRRGQWIIELQAGRNPFTDDVLKDLR